MEIQKTETRARISTNTGRGGCREAAAHGTDHAFLEAIERGKRLPGDDVVACQRAVYSVANAMKYVPRPQ
ncbi:MULTISPECIES: hypothetical protein [unclassified Mesorhizobium]|uniref:hypothetical protein n=1 Tax=unclassified Mesorhizobium TaxID=325217 RepID=UPI0012EB608F|nr:MULTISPECIES: hypothetical protein [unclassified Mesorhizobium]WJI70363.1 hypothetical protein NLY36_06050 [Mesorhizobium sp. C399B]